MSNVVANISMSLDGFITGPNVGVGNGLGDGGERLHDWMFDRSTDADAALIKHMYDTTGAVIIGKRMFEVGFEPWGDPPPFGMPVFVVTHEARAPLPMQGGTTYHFVDGSEVALARAREASGGKNIGVWGGAMIIDQFLTRRLLDEVQLHVVPILLGGGTRLFDSLGPAPPELERVGSTETPAATHLLLRVVT